MRVPTVLAIFLRAVHLSHSERESPFRSVDEGYSIGDRCAHAFIGIIPKGHVLVRHEETGSERRRRPSECYIDSLLLPRVLVAPIVEGENSPDSSSDSTFPGGIWGPVTAAGRLGDAPECHRVQIN